MENTYLCLGCCFMGVLRVFHKYFEGASRSFHECLQKDLNVSSLCFNNVLECFIKKKVYFCVQKSWQLPMQTQLDRNTLRTPLAHPLHIPRGYTGPGGATRLAWSLHQLDNQAGRVAPPAR